MTIPTIGIYNINTIGSRNVPNLYVPNWARSQPITDHLVPPVVVNVGIPIINLPGCAKMHKDNQRHKNGIPIDKNLMEDDPSEIMTLCDAGYPTYDAMNYEPEQLIITRETPPPPVSPPPEVEPPEIPDTGDIGGNEEVLCPGPGQLRVGDVTQSGDERVVGHQLSADGKLCETLYEDTTAVEKFIPSTNQVTNTLAIAVIATAGATATPIILRIVKPILTKIWKTIQKKLGKNVRQLSKSEIEANKYRAKKGLPPLKKK